MTTILPRSAWASTPRPTSALARIDASAVHGVAVHYTGSTTPLGDAPSLDLTCRRLEAERVFHTDPPPRGRGWSDIAYGWAIDQAGRAIECRGHLFKSAANGSALTNSGYGAVTFLIGKGDTPTPAAVAAFLDWRERVWLKSFPAATVVCGHRDLYATECPGGPLYDLVRLGTLAATSEDAMPLDDADIIRLVRHPAFVQAIRDAVWKAGWGANRPDGTPTTETAETRLWRASHPELAAGTIAAEVAARIDEKRTT